MASDINGLGNAAATDQTALRPKDSTGKDTASTSGTQATTASPTAAASVDSVSLSSNAQGLQALEQKIQQLPDVNQQRVADLKAAIDSGQYHVDNQKVADKMLGYDELFK